MNRRTFGKTILGLTAAAVALSFGIGGFAGAVAAQDKLKVGFVYVGPVSDHGYSYQHDVGRRAVEEALGDKVTTTFVENVPEGADAERVIDQLAASGHGLIFTTSFGFMNPTLKVAKRYPNVKFEHATGYKRDANVATYSARFYEGRTIAGEIAGKMTKSNVIGYIASFPIPEVVGGINAFTIALRKVNPEAQVRVVWVNSWYDPPKEAEAAKALLDQSADVIVQHTDSPAPIQVAEQAGKWAVGQSSDMTRFGPKAHLTAIVDDWNGYYIDRVKAVLDGTWQPIDTWGGLKDKMLFMAPYNPAIPGDVVEMVEKTRVDIMEGRRHSFDGPVKDQSGKVVIAEGKHASDEEILKMDWFVEGVVGKLPK
ncbi:BMP family ABC transporter substrate-binding protein [Azospirillum halopraeferens]|uniref:BMP family ABC transporter substrate-binding protein n=1 Tax=Azospirillum halopraeferens TaxID=34010 RepID=UPI00040A3316|nr:BMP family ABC transporter substrate-binding protein [Azospirillum halopraeferens]